MSAVCGYLSLNLACASTNCSPVLPPIITKGLTAADADELTTRTRTAMLDELIRLSHVSGHENGEPLPRASGSENREELKKRTAFSDKL